jgi:hypothetical protein
MKLGNLNESLALIHAGGRKCWALGGLKMLFKRIPVFRRINLSTFVQLIKGFQEDDEL